MRYEILESMPSQMPFGIHLDEPGGGLPLSSPDQCPPFHYATHYMSAAVVLHYLIRMQPYTSCHVQLQAGRFDDANRLFISIREAWYAGLVELHYTPFETHSRIGVADRAEFMRNCVGLLHAASPGCLPLASQT